MNNPCPRCAAPIMAFRQSHDFGLIVLNNWWVCLVCGYIDTTVGYIKPEEPLLKSPHKPLEEKKCASLNN